MDTLAASHKLEEHIRNGNVTEEIISIHGVEDVLITRINNANQEFYMAQYMALCRERRKFGFSLVREVPHTRQYFGVMVNMYDKIPYHKRINLDDNRVTLKYLVPNYTSILKNITILNKTDESYTIDIIQNTYYSISKAVLSKSMDSCNMSEPVIFESSYNPIIAYEGDITFSVTVPKNKVNDWKKLEVCVEAVFCNSEFLRILDSNIKGQHR